MSQNKPIKWPRGWHYPPFSFSEEVKEKIIALLGENHLEGVWIESIVYLSSKQYSNIKSVGIKNKELVKIKEHADALLNLLSNETTQHHLLNKAGQFFGDQLSTSLAKNPLSTFTSLKIIDELKKIKMICDLTIRIDEPGRPGRPKGTKMEAERDLLNRLYYRCRIVSGKPLISTPGKSLLSQLVDILKEPLDIRGDLPLLVRETIESNQQNNNGQVTT